MVKNQKRPDDKEVEEVDVAEDKLQTRAITPGTNLAVSGCIYACVTLLTRQAPRAS